MVGFCGGRGRDIWDLSTEGVAGAGESGATGGLLLRASVVRIVLGRDQSIPGQASKKKTKKQAEEEGRSETSVAR